MRSLGRAAIVALGLISLAATRSFSGPTTTSDWDVTGIHNTEGAYSGTAHLALDQTKATLTIDATTSTGKAISWTATGKLEAGEIIFGKIDLASATFPDELSNDSTATASYVLADDGSVSGYWQLLASSKSTTGKAKTHSGGTETWSFRSGTPIDVPNVAGATPRLPANALKVPTVTQPDEFGCGASSLQAVLYYYRVSDGDLKTLYKPLGTSNSNGTNPPQIVAYARERGLTATYLETTPTLADLQASLAQGDPVMLVIQAWKEDTTAWKDETDAAHWVVLVGMDSTYAYFMDPWAHFGPGYMPLAELADRWHCAEGAGNGFRVIQHEAIFFHGLVPQGDGLVRMR